MRILAALIIVLALVIGIAPQFSNCDAHGHVLKITASPIMASGGSTMGSTASSPVKIVKMKCLWTARSGIAVAVPLAIVGVLLFISRRKETRRALAIITAALGVVAILLPIWLIGTCVTSTMPCNTTMKPTILAAAFVTIAVGVVALVVNELQSDGTDVAPPAT